jgi:hypothetical protein
MYPLSSPIIHLEYQFRLKDGSQVSFVLRLRKPDLHLEIPPRAELPSWTRLTHCQCPNCPLDPTRHPHCPVATSLVDVIESFKHCVSTEPADITIRTESREYHKQAAVQYGVSSLMGLHMVTSGCPVLDKLRPMVHTHLPFASVDETMYRAASMYLLAQYFRQQRGKTPDWKLEHLVQIYESISTVNLAFSRRLLSINPQDASLNALASLDCFAAVTAFSIVRDSLQEMEPLFAAYLEDPPANP